MTLTGGPVFWFLLVLAVVAVVTYFERLVDLRRAQIDWQDFLKGVVNVLDAGNVDEALAICEDTPAPVAQVVATALRHRSGSARILRDAVDSQGRAEVGRLDRRLAALAIIGQIAPSVGLLGTIIGFIKTVMAANAAPELPDASPTPTSGAAATGCGPGSIGGMPGLGVGAGVLILSSSFV